ncbi:36cda4eb-2863-443a-8b90-3593cc815e0a [Thermothielavioides terrestris]|uniref:Cytochrome c oxidase subunit 8, mitochondrial n=1 Tax=Thermothielavioides terrestris TaxID=2587410 RepID=A0A3S4AL67_9PEZI|nr:36cda4eb-2863-443a-8b90-3593cc815e0a [Thermothielavioides terrestris]
MQMLSATAATRTAAARTAVAARSSVSRGLHTTRARLSSPYHYPEGPLSNIPFNPRKRGPGFTIGYWTFCVTGFSLPFLVAVWQTYHPAKA